MSTPPPAPGTTATLDREPPAEARTGPPEPRGTKFGTHQVLWGLAGLIAGLAAGILGTTAESPVPVTAAAIAAASASASASAHAAAVKRAAADRAPAPTGTLMAGDGVYRIGPHPRAGEIRPGTWATRGAIGGRTGSCYVALLRRPGATSVMASEVVSGPARISTDPGTGAIRTSGCLPWHRVGGS